MFRGNIVEIGYVEQVLMAPEHPYTKLLRESIPGTDPEKRWNYKITLLELEHEEYLRKGCKFARRCSEVMEICKTIIPPDSNVEGVVVKCHLYSEAEES